MGTNVIRKEQDLVDMESYDAGYSYGYTDGEKHGYEVGYCACYVKAVKEHNARIKREAYFRKQRFIGAAIIALGALVTLIGHDFTVDIITIPVGLTLILSRKEWIING